MKATYTEIREKIDSVEERSMIAPLVIAIGVMSRGNHLTSREMVKLVNQAMKKYKKLGGDLEKKTEDKC